MALISKEKNFIFLHIFKCAGMSVREAIKGLGVEEFGGGHCIARDINIPDYDKYFKFCYVRNPFDWMVSLYLYHHRFHQDDWACVEHMSFDEFLPYYIEVHMGKEHIPTANKSTTLKDFVTKDGEIIMNYIGRFETLDLDWRVISYNIGIPYQPLPLVNIYPDRYHYRSYYNDFTKSIVAKRFEEDLDLFKYTF